MIVPLELLVDHVKDAYLEDHETEFYGTKAVKISTPTYRVKATMLDVERSRVVEYEFHSMIDPSKPIGQEVGVVTFVDVEHHRKYLTKLRDALDLALGD
jgi:hypothetical protein